MSHRAVFKFLVPKLRYQFLFTFILTISFLQNCLAQEKINTRSGFFFPADSFHNARFYTALGAGIVGYSATVYGLRNAWYNQYASSEFHFYNDMGEWANIDKYGHAYTTYLYTDLLHDMTIWTGVNDRTSLWMAAGAANLFQLTIEIMDGYNTRWGFSVWDLGFNFSGSALYVGQELLWDEQRIRLKFSTFPQTYSSRIVPSADNSGTMTYKERTQNLYGTGLASRLLKDYNGQTYWLSVNLASFGIPHPQWLNWAIGVGAYDIYGGFDNEWIADNTIYRTPFSPTTVFYLSPDINWTAFKGKNGFINSLLELMNYIKAPLPAISVDMHGNIEWYLVFF